MPRESANRLVDFLEEQAGEHLRGAIHYSGDEYVSLYMRDDVDALYPPEKMSELVAHYRQENHDQTVKEPFDLGNKHCTVSFYDDAILFHFTQGDEIGTVITLEPEAGRNIVGFITECLKQLHYNSPQEITSAPRWLRD
ncbi:hypothetical protein SAMN04488063_0570 [Halopelagius inordinatus]|uniref:Uncharacterized protein n=1 Tax=Halopelagius inordinatus TaxID=553467 RepID=A0A1I2M4D2_9EURY|nr:hypothetical protein [Halopelagius inordinatus]SFF86374.1 hypothetical protein SAMN04488063_0570 [Halopelagius inordinatus]